MYAIISTGGKQYRVQKGDTIDVELLDAESPAITFTDVLLLADGEKVTVGTPNVAGATVKAEVQGEIKGDKVVAFKYKRRKNYRRTVGHRQRYNRVTITEIAGA
jgi:large subunit ribosomal protein L21